MTIENTEWLTIREAAKISGVTKSAISAAINNNKLKAQGFCSPHRWLIDPKDLEEYRKNKYSRALLRHNGELVFDKSMGFYSVSEAAKMLNVSAQTIYYSARIGILKANRKGAAWIIHIDDIQEFKEKYIRQKIEKKAVLAS
jgi:excisionase family DNA binding protein